MRNKTAYPFKLRVEHTLLPEEFEGKAPKGPYEVDKFTFRDLKFQDITSSWSQDYLSALRELGLKYWIGSEFDIAVIRRYRLEGDPTVYSDFFHVPDERLDTTIRLVTSASWIEEKALHRTNKKTNYIQLISYLLTYLNAVFFDDAIDGISRLYFKKPLSRPMGDELKIVPRIGIVETYNRKDYWTPELEKLYASTGTTKAPHRTPGSLPKLHGDIFS